MAAAPDGSSAIAHEGRPVDGAYVVVSADDDGSKGIMVTAYDADALEETKLSVSWDVVRERLGDAAKDLSSDTSLEQKKPLYAQFLKDHVIVEGGEKKKLKLKDADFEGVNGVLFDRPGESQVLGSTLDSHSEMPPASPIGRPSTSEGAERRASSGLDQRPKTTAVGRRRKKKKLGGSKSTGGLGSPMKTDMRPIAGYKPPTDLSAIDDEVVEKAQTILKNDKQLNKMLKNEVFKMAAGRVGVDIDELRPRDLMYFRTGPTEVERLKMLKRHYDQRRQLSMSLALMEYRSAEQIVKGRNDRKARHHKSLSEGFLSTLEAEKGRLDKIALNRSKIETVAENENVTLRARRAAFDKKMAASAARQEKLMEMRQQQRDYLHKQAAERQEMILRVQEQKEAREKARIEHIRNSGSGRAEVLARHERNRREMQAAKERRLREREVERQRKREDVSASQTLRREMLTQQLTEKAKSSELVRAARLKEQADKTSERFLVAKSRQENAQRVRREKEFHQKQVMDRISASYEVMDYMKELRAAVDEKRRENKRQMIINIDRWKDTTALERSITPGPGEYEVGKSAFTMSGGTWGKYSPKSDLDWVIYRASQLPGPGEYKAKDINGPTGGSWGKYAPKSDVEWQIYRASQIPGPGDYDPKDLPPGYVPTFGNFDPKGELDIIMDRARQEPGPADYADRIPDIHKPTLKRMEKKLQVSAKKVVTAAKFVGALASAAGDSKDAIDDGRAAVMAAVSPAHVRQTKAMLAALDAGHKAEAAALAGDVEGAQKHARKAQVAARRASLGASGTGMMAGKNVTGESDSVAKTAEQAATKARRASLVAAQGRADAEKAATGSSTHGEAKADA